MTSRRYTILGWLVWQIATRMAKRKVPGSRGSRAKLGAAAGVVAVLVAGGVLAARSSGDD